MLPTMPLTDEGVGKQRCEPDDLHHLHKRQQMPSLSLLPLQEITRLEVCV